MSKKSSWLSFSALAIVFLGGCGSDSGDDSGAGGTSSKQIDACAIVTQQDATSLFAEEASPEPPDVVGGLILGQCHWTWDTATENQLLQFYIWNGPEAYGTPSDSTPFAIGDQGNIRVVPGVGQGLVDVMWIQSSMTISLDYSAIGKNVPIAQAKVDAMKALAQATSSKLQSK